MPSRYVFLVAGLASMLNPESALGQRGTATASPCALSSQLLNRIAAAVDGYDNGEQVWVVTRCSDTASVIATATTLAEARRRGNATTAILGPYRAKLDQWAARMLGHFAYCWHEKDTSVLRPSICDEQGLPAISDVTGITVTFRLRSGQTIERPLPVNADVLFLNYSGLEKFAFPYYQGILGLTGVGEMRAAMFSTSRR